MESRRHKAFRFVRAFVLWFALLLVILFVIYGTVLPLVVRSATVAPPRVTPTNRSLVGSAFRLNPERGRVDAERLGDQAARTLDDTRAK